MENILSTILLFSIVIASAILVHVFISGALSELFASTETELKLSYPLVIEKTFVQEGHTCFIVRNPNDKSTEVNDISIYIDGKLYPHTSDCNKILPEDTCRLCVEYFPDGGENVKLSASGPSYEDYIPRSAVPDIISLSCSSCSDCSAKLITALSLANEHSKRAVVNLTTDLFVSGDCIWVSKTNFLGIVTFDGGEHSITGDGTGIGFDVDISTGLTIKNLELNNFYTGLSLSTVNCNNIVNLDINNCTNGIYLSVFSGYNSFSDSTLKNNSYGIYLSGSSNNEFNGLTLLNNNEGIRLWGSSNSNTFSNITILNSGTYGIYIVNSSSNSFSEVNVQESDYYDVYIPSSSSCSSTFTNVTVSRGKPLYYCNSACELNGLTDPNLQDASLIILCDADGSKIEHVNVCGAGCAGGPKNNGVFVMYTDNAEITDINSSENRYGIYFYYSSADLSDINAFDNSLRGIYMYESSSDFSLLDSNTYICSNGIVDVYLSNSELNCVDCNNGFYFHLSSLYGTGFNCSCYKVCP